MLSMVLVCKRSGGLNKGFKWIFVDRVNARMRQCIRMQDLDNIGNTRELWYSNIYKCILALGKITFASIPRNTKLLTEKIIKK